MATRVRGRLKTLRRSLGVRRCCRCGRLIGVRMWPWSGKLILETHGFCERCTAHLLEAVAEVSTQP